MSFNIKNYLQDIDAEIVQHRQEIAKHRLRISELEDTRVLMMQREEYRAAMQGGASPFGTIEGAEIVTRDRQLMEQGALSHAAKTGQPLQLTREEKVRQQKRDYQRRKREEKKAQGIAGTGLNAVGNRRGMNQPRTKAPNGSGSHTRYKAAVIAMLRGGVMLDVSAIIDRLGEGPKQGKDRQPVYQALYELKRDGVVFQPGGPGTYQYKQINATPAAGH